MIILLLIGALIFFGVLNSIIGGNRNRLVESNLEILKHSDPQAYEKLVTDQRRRKTRECAIVVLAFGLAFLSAVFLYNGQH